MAKVNGKDALLQIDYAHVLYPVGCARSITFDIQNDFIETSVTGSGRFRTYIPAAGSFSGTLEGLVFLETPFDATMTMDALYAFLIGGDLLNVTYYEEDVTHTNWLKKEITVYIESITETASFDNMATFSVNFKGTGSPTITSGNV